MVGMSLGHIARQYREIVSRTNPFVTLAASLRDKKGRDASGLFAAEGVKLLGDMLAAGVAPRHLIVTHSAARKFPILAEVPPCDTVVVTDEVYAKITGESSPQGVMCLIAKADCPNVRVIPRMRGPAAALWGVQDPGNAGTIIRAAAALGMAETVLCGSCADPFSPKVVRATMGAVFRHDIALPPGGWDPVEEYKAAGFEIYAACPGEGSVDIRDVKFGERSLVILGSEGGGLPEEITSRCVRVGIPMAAGAESLNVASAAAVLFWQVTSDK